MTQPVILRITDSNLDPKLLRGAAAILTDGGIIAFPTETVYGIGCLLSYKKSIERIYAVKGRDFNKPLAIYLANLEALRAEAQDISPSAAILINRFLPGALTVILRNKDGIPTGYRISPHKVLLSLLELLPVPIVGTSANKSGEKDPVSANEVIESIGEKLDLIIDSGPCLERIPSTVVDCTCGRPKILREGKILRQDIEQALNNQ
jgi:L-threonylcarbamoyladenylate synthase